jgi:DNA-directed RNA polymerase specialized sigma24 family protein
MGGMPADQVARSLGLQNAKAVYNRVYRALAQLRERLERSGIGAGNL